jgi:hypothetical protein
MKNLQFSKFVVTLVIALNILFTAGILYVFMRTGSEPSTLVACWFAFTTGELWALSSIKKRKLQQEDKQQVYKQEGDTNDGDTL